MPGVAIVALPDEQDRVNKVSSEKVAHLTLMYLGENIPADSLQRIVLFVQHVASMTRRFGLVVDHRGTLGADDADVLFFEKDRYTKELKDILAAFLGNRDIYEAYNSTEQFPEWTPHLTLGYPATPANDKDLDYGITYVEFDRFAVWTGDSEGPEFRLKGWADAVAWSDVHREVGSSALDKALGTLKADAVMSAEEYLEHYGIKGMRWGIRRSDRELAAARAAADPDAIKAVETQAKIKAAGSLNVVSSKDLSQLVKRMQLEQSYIKATLESSPTTKKGKSFLSKVIANERDSLLLQGKPGPVVKLAQKLLQARQAKAAAFKAPARGKNPLARPLRAAAGPAGRRTQRAQHVYTVTTMGQGGNHPNPFVPAIPPRRGP